MGFFGTSEKEEQALREASRTQMNHFDSRSSLDATASSAYETASEFETESYQAVTTVPEPDVESTSTVHNENPDSFQKNSPSSAETRNTQSGPPHEFSSRKNSKDVLSPEEEEENRLQRSATSRTEETMSPEIVRSITRGEPVHLRDLQYDGPTDKENPSNWPSWKKWAVTFIIANACLCVSLGSTLYVEGVPELEEKFNISSTLAISGLSFYLLGLSIGPVIASPLSELIGRRYIYLTTFPAAILFTMGVGLAQNTRTLLILRFFAGFVTSPPMAIAGGTISDIWSDSPEQLSTAMALFSLSPFLGPVIGPIVGGFAAQYKNWRWTMWVAMMFYGAVLPFLLWCPETFKPIILRRRAKARGIKVIADRITLNDFFKIHMIRPVEMLVVEPIVGFSSIYSAFIFAVLFGFFEAFPIIFRGEYSMSLGISGLPFIAVGIGLIVANALFIWLDRSYYFPKNPDGTRGKRDENGNLIWDAPETRLLIVKIGSFFLPISLFWLAWTAKKSIHWIVPTLAAVPFGFGLLWVFFGILLYYSMSFPPAYVASALAANNLLRYLVAGAFPLFTVQMYDNLGIDWATSVFAFIALAMILIPFAFDKYGLKLRSKSKYGYVALFRKLALQKEAEAKAAAADTENNSTHSEQPALESEKDINENSSVNHLQRTEENSGFSESERNAQEVANKV